MPPAIASAPLDVAMTLTRRIRKTTLPLLCLCAGLAMCAPLQAQAQETDPAGSASTDRRDTRTPVGWKTMHYLDVPLRLTIRNGEESVLRFPWAVEPGFPSSLIGMLDQPRVIGDTFYLTPASPFDFERFTFLSPETGAIILMDIRSSDESLPARVMITDARLAEAAAEAKSTSPALQPAPDKPEQHGVRYTHIELARYAMQQVYAPDRLIQHLPGLTEVSVKQPVVVQDLVPGARVDAVPWKEWRTPDGRYLTVLAVQNRGSFEVSLDPTLRRHSRHEIASTPYRSVLAPAGMPGDETALVIISRVAWADAISAYPG